MKKLGYNFWIILLAVIVVFFGLYIWGSKLRVEQDNSSQELKTEAIKKKENEINKKIEEEFEQCKQGLTLLNNEQIVEKINSETSGVPVYITAGLLNYFKCDINKNYELGKFGSINDSAHKISFDNVKILTFDELSKKNLEKIRNVAEIENYQSSEIDDDKLFFEKYQEESLIVLKEGIEKNLRFPIYHFIKSDLDKICPNNDKNEEMLNWLVSFFSQNSDYPQEDIIPLLNDYCIEIKSYSEDQEKLDKEIYNFKNWSSDDNLRMFQIEWKTLLAYRFGGREKSGGICLNISDEKDNNFCRNTYEAYSLIIELTDNYSDDCQDEYSKMIDGICRLTSD